MANRYFGNCSCGKEVISFHKGNSPCVCGASVFCDFPANSKYRVVLADPPWSYKFSEPTASKGGSRGSGYSAGVNYYYPIMTLSEIQSLQVADISHKDSVLFLWATNPLLPEAIETMGKWGFKYKTCITWQKERCKGMGYWFRGHTEHLLFGIRGNVKAFRSREKNIVSLPVGKHSEKPSYFRDLIEKVTDGMFPRIELFARSQTQGWDVFGNEVEGSIRLLTPRAADAIEPRR